MKKAFQEHHLLKALSSYDSAPLPLDISLANYFRNNRALGSKDRKFVTENIYTLVRWMGLIDYFCKGCTWDERFRVKEKLDIKKTLTDQSIPPHVRVSFPKTLFHLLKEHYGEEKALQLCLISNAPAPTTIRVNPLKTNRQSLLRKWRKPFNVIPTKNSVFGIQFPKRLNFQTLEEFKKGYFEVQDEASQLVANLIDPKPGDRVIDFCAGSGGKTLAFAHKLRGKGEIYLHDIRPKALHQAQRRLKRAGIENAQLLPHDSPNRETLKQAMDWILVDAPCTGSGTLRRNPDLKWKFSEEMLKQITANQREILKQALEFLKPSGKIVYATCSILPQENGEQATHFQEEFGLDLTSKPFHSLPAEGGMDGFYAAVFQIR